MAWEFEIKIKSITCFVYVVALRFITESKCIKGKTDAYCVNNNHIYFSFGFGMHNTVNIN